MPHDIPFSKACPSKFRSSSEGEEDTQAVCNAPAAIFFSGQFNSQDPKLKAVQPKMPLGRTASQDLER